MATTIRKPYAARTRCSIDFIDPETGEQAIGRTKQAHASMCDVNNIIKQYDKTGLFAHVNNAVAEYGDYTEVNEFAESLNRVIQAQDAFDQLPSLVRKRFGNDAGEFFEFATNPANAEEMVKLGLAEMREPLNIVTETPAETQPKEP